jgi:hypothetical protein
VSADHFANDTSFPRVHYRNQWNGEDKDATPHCLAYSIASTLHHIGFVEEARLVAEEDPSDVANLLPVLEDVFHKVSSKKIDLTRTRHPDGPFNPLLPHHRTSNLVVASLKARSALPSSRGRKVLLNHTVCFLGDLVFDSNRSHSVEINKKNLDDICGDIVSGAEYDGLYWSRELLIACDWM